MAKEENVKNCGDGWERFSGGISSLSISLLSTLLFILVISYFMMKGLQGVQINIPVEGQTVTVNYPEVKVPIDFLAIRNSVIYLFGAILLGLPVPLFSEKLRPLKIAISLFQVGVFVYALYIFVRVILDFTSAFL
ncbi:hypothetical protein E3E23_03140 [Thermococcus sp. CX2]|uniref:hypothetical protein n=1 Tax=Thermococcus sp. CX2 TaxID=163006 RepID=UPI00143A0123|nr:hypothetical protein [Thermococcus sp. CX2]NJE84831.1 hypothetical protein [Thermococcus sp. CX2]